MKSKQQVTQLAQQPSSSCPVYAYQQLNPVRVPVAKSKNGQGEGILQLTHERSAKSRVCSERQDRQSLRAVRNSKLEHNTDSDQILLKRSCGVYFNFKLKGTFRALVRTEWLDPGSRSP